MSDKKRVDLELALIRAGGTLAAKKEVDHLLFISDLPLSDEMIKARSPARKKLVQAVTSESQRAVYDAMGWRALLLPAYDLPRHEKFKVALVGGMAKGWFQKGETVLAMVSKAAASYPDSLMLVTVGEESETSTSFMAGAAAEIPSQVMNAVLSLALSIAEEGWEGHPIGSLFVVGDSTRVMEKSRQLTLNPFQGYSENDRNIHDPKVREAIKNFAVLDGAFVIRQDGVVLAAGRYLSFESGEFEVPLGLGARHTAGAGISRDTDAVALVVSQSSGVVTVFEAGKVVMRMDSRQRRSWNLESIALKNAFPGLADTAVPAPEDVLDEVAGDAEGAEAAKSKKSEEKKGEKQDSTSTKGEAGSRKESDKKEKEKTKSKSKGKGKDKEKSKDKGKEKSKDKEKGKDKGKEKGSSKNQ